MNVRMSLLGSLLLAALVLPASSETMQQTDAAAQTQNPVPTGTQTATLPAQSPATQGSAPLRVMVGKSLLINTTERLRRISITDPAIAFAQVITPTQILVHGKSPGEVSLLIWDELERSRSFDLRVDVDVSACAEEEHEFSPKSRLPSRLRGRRSFCPDTCRPRICQARRRTRRRLFAEGRKCSDLWTCRRAGSSIAG